jgi:Fe-S cluster assembly protein SufD
VSHPATVIVAGRDCSLSVVETYAGTPGPALTNASTTIRAGERARIRHWRIEAEATDAVHIGHTGVVQHEGAEVLLLSVLHGATIGRHAHDVVLAGPDARCDVVGLAVPAGRQVHDHLVTVEHAAARCTSTQRFRAVVDDRARSSFSGHVIVRPGTVATSADQSSHNLLLAPTAEADARPWLEILADDVRCTHGATVGRLDDDALFYLRSRGIPLAQARDVLIDAFVQELLDRIDCTPLRARIESELAGRRRGAEA